MYFAFVVVSKKNAKNPFREVIVRGFEGGYIGWMAQEAQQTAKKMNGKLERSTRGFLIEAGNPTEIVKFFFTQPVVAA
jgi:hypothetical protein